MNKTAENYRRERVRLWDETARLNSSVANWGRFYHKRLAEIMAQAVHPAARVLEIGCGNGRLLAALRPGLGIGIDFSEPMLEAARHAHPHLHFICADGHFPPIKTRLDFIILSDLLNDVWDVQGVLKQVAGLSSPNTRILINIYSRLWEPLLEMTIRLKLAKPLLRQNWLAPEDLRNLLFLENMEIVRQNPEILWPLGGSLPHFLFNKFLVRFWPFKQLALTNFYIARIYPTATREPDPVVSVIVPARNESGNIRPVIESIPEMGRGTEIVFVEGHSKDDTYQKIEEEIAIHPEKECVLLRQPGVGKGDAVRFGFKKARGQMLIILDADLTVPPELLPQFYRALLQERGDLINGVRLVYPRDENAMRFLNLLGNKFFSIAISWLIGQPVKDTLCGTKALWKSDYLRIAASRPYFGEFDPFGDFDLIFNAARLGLKIVDLPVRYRGRTFGQTNIHRWRHGAQLLRMLLVAARKLKFT